MKRYNDIIFRIYTLDVICGESEKYFQALCKRQQFSFLESAMDRKLNAQIDSNSEYIGAVKT
jgi:hypothetical protein